MVIPIVEYIPWIAFIIVAFSLINKSPTKKNNGSSLAVKQYFSPYGKISPHKNWQFKSKGEKQIAKFLEKNNIRYLYEIPIKQTPYRTDFYLVDFDVYVEYWGLANLKNKVGDEYRQKLENKKKIYMALGLKLISIYAEDLSKLPVIFNDYLMTA